MEALFFLIGAAICYTTPFLLPDYCCMLIFFFPLFLFILLSHHNPSYQSLLYWSLAITSIHLLALCDALIKMASGPLLLRILPPCILIAYVTCYPTIWLCIMYTLLKWYRHTLIKQLVLWTVGLWGYLLIIDQLLFWIFGRNEGFLFMHPLLPLSIWPSWITFIKYVPNTLALAWFCITSSLITVIFLQCNRKTMLILLCGLMPWLAGFIPVHHSIPSWLTTVGHIPLLLPPTIAIEMGTMLLNEELRLLHKKHPLVTTVILPESSWNGTALSSIANLPSYAPITNLIIGSFGEQHSHYFNRLYCFIDGILWYHYDKRHSVPLTERKISAFYDLNNTLFFQKTPPVIPATIPKLPWILPTIGSMVPYICSELFCNTNPDDPYNDPILCLVNDWWFQMPHFQKLMALAARLQALRWNRPILYISYYYAQFFDVFGQSAPIATTAQNRYIS